MQEYLNVGFRTPELVIQDNEMSMVDHASLRQSIGSSNVPYMSVQQAKTYRDAIESLSQSPVPAHNALAISL